MKTFFTKAKNLNNSTIATIDQLENALGVMTEYAYFMASESGITDRIDHIFDILRDNDITWNIEEY